MITISVVENLELFYIYKFYFNLIKSLKFLEFYIQNNLIFITTFYKSF